LYRKAKERHRDRQTGRLATYRQINKQAGRPAGRQTERQTDRQPDIQRQTDRQTERQTDRQTKRQTSKYLPVLLYSKYSTYVVLNALYYILGGGTLETP
jgi:hypothetical protein